MKLLNALASECRFFDLNQVVTRHNAEHQQDSEKNIRRVGAMRNYLKKIKKAPVLRQGLLCFKAWRCPTLTWGDPTLPSALSGFTSEFEMGSGGSRLLLPPGKPVIPLHSCCCIHHDPDV
jgi:hypothetical protein